MLLLLIACTSPSTPSDASPSSADSRLDSPADSPEDSPEDSDRPELELCPALEAPSGPTTRIPAGSSTSEIQALIDAASPGDSLLFEDGTYAIESPGLWVNTESISLRSFSSDRDAVILDGNWEGGSLLNLRASDVQVAELTVRRSYWHPIHVTPNGADISGVLLYDLVVEDPGQQAIKINTDGGDHYSDAGLVACSVIRMTDAGRAKVRDNCYTGGVDAHQARDWVIRDNHISGFWCEAGLSEHGVHFWRGSRDTLVERNLLVDNARGIGFGLYEDEDGRSYTDAPCEDGAGHYGGVIRNNAISVSDERVFASASGMDGGVALASSCSTTVAHNTVFSTQAPFASLEYRFERSDPVLLNNLLSHDLKPRDATAERDEGNDLAALAEFFVDAEGHDLHLVEGAEAIDRGVEAGVDEDFEGQERTGAPDLGADEL